jgi:hypothetical protein
MDGRPAVLAAALALAIACAHGSDGMSPTPGGPSDPGLGQEVALKPGESVTIAGEGLRLVFRGVPTDSRCPTGVTCVWAGDAVVQLSAHKPPNPQATAELHTDLAAQRETTYAGYRVRLVGLAPYPAGETPIDPRAYVATVVVSR